MGQNQSHVTIFSKKIALKKKNCVSSCINVILLKAENCMKNLTEKCENEFK